MKDADKMMKALEYDRFMESDKWTKEIPSINFPSDWSVTIVPPMVGAVVRFKVEKGDAFVSVYLDCYANLGAVSKPYWEVYPYNSDVFRCDMNDTSELLKAIEISIKEQN